MNHTNVVHFIVIGMDRNLVFDKCPKTIESLGSGYSNVHLNIRQIDVEEFDMEKKESKVVKKWQAEVQRVKDPVTYDKIVDAAVCEEFTDGAAEAALRKGILDPKDEDFVKLNDFAESVKAMCKKSNLCNL